MNKRNLFIIIITIGVIMLVSLFIPSSGGDLDPEAFKEKLKTDPGVIVDVRTPEEYQEGHLADAGHHMNFLSDEFEQKIDNLDKEETYYLYCRTGNRSGKAMKKMQRAGFKQVYNVGGYDELVSSGFSSAR
ncbi:MAG: rhodanese-like domain-containing protein [Balneolaceae bacterium]